MTKEPVQIWKSRREQLRERLVAAAEAAVSRDGLGAMRAREIAAEAGCALGAIYTVFEDLDELILAVNARTLAQLEASLSAAERAEGAEALQRLARGYLDYARAESPRWRALFEHRMPHRPPPSWYAQERERLFSLLEAPLARLAPRMPQERLHALARTLFSAVHGIVQLGLEEKLAPTAPEALDAELAQFIATIVRGLEAPAAKS
jgi:AcrR family transcriptional regulator